jgi:ABC-type glutathione transport system ATPase component
MPSARCATSRSTCAGRRVFAGLTVEENLRAGGVTLPGRAQPAGLLSGGEQQMLAIGRALMAGPQLLLLDEPARRLAPQVVGQVAEIVLQINARGTALVLVEQNAAMALRIAHRALVLEVGRITLEGEADDARDHRPQRRRQVQVPERADGRLSRRARRGQLRRPTARHAAPAPDRPARDQPHVPEPRTVTGATVAENLLVGRHRLTRAGFVSTSLALPSARGERRRQLGHVREVPSYGAAARSSSGR